MRRLTSAELDAYDVLPRALATRVRIQCVPFLAPGSNGMTVGRIVFLRNDGLYDGSRKIIAHELVHVRQYYELGVLRFLTRYLADYARALATHTGDGRLPVAAEVVSRAAYHREGVPDDARAWGLYLTAKGQRLTEQLRRRVRQHDRRFAARIDTKERRQLLRLLDKLVT